MSEHLEAGQLLDLDQGGQFGPLFDVAQNHLAECSYCRHAHLECEALRALALEASIHPDSGLQKRALSGARKIEVQERLQATKLPLKEAAVVRESTSNSEAFQSNYLYLVAALGFAGILLLAYLRQGSSWFSPKADSAYENAPETPGPLPSPSIPPTPAAPSADATAEASLDKKARQLFLADAARRHDDERAEATAQRKPAPSPRPSLAPTLAPRPTQMVIALPTPSAGADDSVDLAEKNEVLSSDAGGTTQLPPASFQVEHRDFAPTRGDSAQFLVSLPDTGSVEIRVFDINGRSVKLVTDGVLPGGPSSIPFPGRNEDGSYLSPGSYYVRIMTRWFSRVEALQVLP